MNWMDKSRCRIILDLHFPEWDPEILSRADSEQVMDNMARAGVDCALLYAKCHNGNSYYPTKIGHQHACLRGRDFFGECVAAARKRGIAPIAYYSVVWDKRVATEHPDWVMRGPQGQPLDDPQWWAYICYTNQGYRDLVKGQVKELAETYPVDGFWLDMLIFDSLTVSCYCDNCQRLFRERTNQAIPTTPSWDSTWREFLEFRYSTLEEFGREVIAVIKAVNPQLTAAFNYHGYPYWSWKTSHRPLQHCLFNDYATGEYGFEGRGFGYLGIHNRFLRAIPLRQPYEVLTTCFSGAYYSLKPVEQLKLETFTALASGGAFTIVDQPFQDGRVSEVAYDRIGEVFREAKRKSELFGGEPLRETAIYFSVKTRDLYGRDQVGRYLMEFNGVCRSLIESHIAVDVLLDENLSLEQLRRYPVVWLPEVACMSEKEAALFTDYVQQGGNLIATHFTSLFDENGEQRQDFLLSGLFGAHYIGPTETETNYFRLADPAMGHGIDPRFYVQCTGPGAVVSPTDGAQPWGDFHNSFYERKPGRFFSHNAHPPGARAGPLAVQRRAGRGRVIYFALALGTSYAGTGRMMEHRLLIANATCALLPGRVLEITAPPWVEASAMEQQAQGRVVVHLTASQPTPQITTPWEECGRMVSSGLMMETPPCYQARVRINLPFASVRGVDAEARMVDPTTVELAVASTHAVLVIEKGGSQDRKRSLDELGVCYILPQSVESQGCSEGIFDAPIQSPVTAFTKCRMLR